MGSDNEPYQEWAALSFEYSRLKMENTRLRLEVASLRAKVAGESLAYSYWNGQEFLHTELHDLFKRMIPHGLELSTLMTVSESESSQAAEAFGRVAVITRDLFRLTDKLTNHEVSKLLGHFLDRVEAAVKGIE